jgi:hypothetical protein
MLLIYRKEYKTVPLKMLSINDGRLLHDIKCPVVPKKPVEFVEQSNGKVLMKQLGENLTIYDVVTKTSMTVERFRAPSAFIFLYINSLFLTFRGTKVSAWDFHGKQATKFEDHELWSPEASTNNNFISEDQHLLISFCKNKREGRSVSSLNISHCVTGELIHKLDAPQRLFMPPPILSTVEEEGQEMVEMGSNAVVRENVEEEEEDAVVAADETGDETGGEHIVDSAPLTTAGTASAESASSSAASPGSSSASASSSTAWTNRSISSSPSANEDKLRTEALDGVTAIFFNEDHSEIYTGNRRGQVWVWGH